MTLNRALVVGPHPRRAAVVLGLLEGQGCELCFAENCAQAFSLLKRTRFDLVLSQLMLNDGAADQFLRPLENTPAHVFFSSTLENDSWWLHALDGGRNCWWKPKLFRPEELAFFLQRWMHAGSVPCQPVASMIVA